MKKFMYILCLFICYSFSQDEKWNVSAEKEIEQIKINGETIRKMKKNVRFFKKNQIIITDNAIQNLNNDILHMNGNTMMINGLDTLTCDSMIYWSKLDSGYAMGDVNYIQSSPSRKLFSDYFYYWKTEGFRGSSFITKGDSRLEESDYLISADKIHYDDETQIMILEEDASIKNSKRGIFGNEMIIQYNDSLINDINITSNAHAYNDIKVKIEKNGLHRKFRDKMSSKEMLAFFNDGEISELELFNMASTSYNVVDDSLLVGKNLASGDSIYIIFFKGEINRIQVKGGALGEFHPEQNNSKVDTTISYGAEFLDYHINDEITFLEKNAYVEYQNTKLSSGKIMVDWETNLLDAIKSGDDYPKIKTADEAPMHGNSMIFDIIEKHGQIDQGRTSYNQSFYHGKKVYRDDPNIFHVKKSKYTSCELEHPHFYLASKKMKMYPGEKVIAKPLWLFIYDVPIIGIPLAIFPNKGGNRHSGWLMPSFDSYATKGTGFRNFGYYWAPNDYLDTKMLMNFFDKEGFNFNSKIKYKRRFGTHWYNYKYSGDFISNFKRRIISEEITDLKDSDKTTEDFRLKWTHNQTFDPTQSMRIKYEYVSNKDAYQNNQEVNLENRLKQNLSSSFNYNKNWQMMSFSIGYSTFRNLSIENKTPESFNDKIDGLYKPYKYGDGPKVNLNISSRKFFGEGDKWYNSLMASYNMRASRGRDDYLLIMANDSTWGGTDMLKKTHGGIKQTIQLNAPQTFFQSLIINPRANIYEDWLFNYKFINQLEEEEVVSSFKRRFTWDSAISAKTTLYGLMPINLGKINSIRHVMTPVLSFSFRPDFSNSSYGGNNYFQKLNNGEHFDYFKNSYVGSTSSNEQKTYALSINNVFQVKKMDKNDDYQKANFLTWNSSISYNAVKDTLYQMTSDLWVKNFSGYELMRIKMKHNFYKFDQNDNPMSSMIDLSKGEFPKLTYIEFFMDLKSSFYSYPHKNINSNIMTDSENLFDEQSINKENDIKKSIWESHFDFRYSTDWKLSEKQWNYNFSLYSTHKINLSKNWAISYGLDFNLKEKEIIRNEISIKRPIHCWEFSFNYWPGNSYSSGFSLRINVKNPDLQDIKLTSQDGRRGFNGY